ncbi:MAG: aminoglycoside 6'-N-acetyltransferase [Faecousia sp.]
MIEIRKAGMAEVPAAAGLALLLWPEHDFSELSDEFSQMVGDDNAALFLAFHGATPMGFAQCQLRHDYVEGTDSTPVGYLEGIFVADGFRKNGVARSLLTACESWAKGKGCTEFASDCELTNTQSLQFHLNMGFREANRIICFTKKLGG